VLVFLLLPNFFDPTEKFISDEILSLFWTNYLDQLILSAYYSRDMLLINIHKMSHPPLNLCLDILLYAPAKNMVIVSILRASIMSPHGIVYLYSSVFMYFYVVFFVLCLILCLRILCLCLS